MDRDLHWALLMVHTVTVAGAGMLALIYALGL